MCTMKKHRFSSFRFLAVLLSYGTVCESTLRGQGASVRFSNLEVCAGVNVPCYDANGAKLSGASVFAQLYVGPSGTPEHGLSAIGPAQPFRSGASAGYWMP